ncbi:MAG: hypothetical protein V3U13_09425 [Gemmatimonadota bacterium]
MHTVERVAVAAAVVLGLSGCGAGGGTSTGSATPGLPEGASSPEQAVETFLDAVTESQRAKAAGEFTEADRAYERMASVFGTEEGSISRSFSAQEVRDRMIVLSACFRPMGYRIITQPDPQAWQARQTTVTVQLRRSQGVLTLPFVLVLGRGDRWFVQQIVMSSVTC